MRSFAVLTAVLAFSLAALGLVTAQGRPVDQATPPPEGSPLASPVSSPAACPVDTLPGRLVSVPNDVTIHLTDEGFDPASIQTTNNSDVTIRLMNTGSSPHSFVLEDFEVDIELSPGQRETIRLQPVDLGDAVTHHFVSDAPGDVCMSGVLILYI